MALVQQLQYWMPTDIGLLFLEKEKKPFQVQSLNTKLMQHLQIIQTFNLKEKTEKTGIGECLKTMHNRTIKYVDT